MSRFKVVIPSRWAASRLPGKPLADIAGAPMVVRCLMRARASNADEVVVAVDDERIAAAVRAAGGDAQMTDPAHASGTDRLAEVARARGWSDETVVVNLQGDEPLLPSGLVDRLAAAAELHSDAGVVTMAVPITNADELFRESVVKVVLDDRGYALYFSRAPIPWVRGAFAQSFAEPVSALPEGVPFLRHLGLYGYRVSTLRAISDAPRAACEVAESLEQLRAMAGGVRIHVTVLEAAPPPGVDTPEDLEEVRRIFAE